MRPLNEILASKRVLIGRKGLDGFSGEIHLYGWSGSIICTNGGGLKFYQIGNRYRCFHCGTLWNVVGFGQSEREFICERGRNEQVQNTINKE